MSTTTNASNKFGGYLEPREAGTRARMALGTMNFGKRTNEREAREILDEALKEGISLFDTANAYNDGESERIVGRAFRHCRSDVLIATKVGFQRINKKPEGLSRSALRAALQSSLDRLQTDYVDLYYLHAPDHQTPIEESLETMHEFLRAGQVRAWGISNYASWQILEMNLFCEKYGMPKPSVSQVLYNLLIRELEIEYFAFARRFPIHTTVYNPLAGGLLSGKHSFESVERGGRFDNNKLYLGRYWSKQMFDLVDQLKPIAAQEKMSLVEFAYAWTMEQPGVDSILVGPVTLDHLKTALSACARTLSRDALDAANALYRDHLGTDTHYVR